MAQIHNSDVTKGLSQNAGLAPARDKIPNELAEKIVPTFETNPEKLRRVNIIKSANAINATSATIYTTPTTQDFYLTYAQLGLIKDATATSLYSRILINLDGTNNVYILHIPGLTTTAQQQVISAVFDPPIKLARNTPITVINSTNNANVTSSGSIAGYVVDSVA